MVLFGASALAIAEPVKHPNLLLNQEEIEQIKTKIHRYPWAAQFFQKVAQLLAALRVVALYAGRGQSAHIGPQHVQDGQCQSRCARLAASSSFRIPVSRVTSVRPAEAARPFILRLPKSRL